MKKYIKNYFILSLSALLLIVSCDEGDAVVNDVVDGTTRGAALRGVNLISNELAIGESDAEFAIELEVQDAEEGDLLSSVNVYVGFRDNTVEAGGMDLDVAESLFETITLAEFEDGPFGLPRTTYSATLTELAAFTGVNEADLFGGDQFQIRFEIVLTDDRTFSSTNSNPGNLGGSFFNSPFVYFPTVICPVPAEAFTGSYNVVQTVNGIFGIEEVEAGTYELVSNGGTVRSLDVVLYPGFGGFDDTLTFDLICDSFSYSTLDTGLACVAGGDPIIFSAADTTTMYDVNDDSSFSLIINVEGGSCGGNTDIVLEFTKQ
jgi:hypothetical protein